MPVEYLTPGVYVEEIDSGLKPIAGVGTNTAGIIGEVKDDVSMPAQPGKFEMEDQQKLDDKGNPVLDNGKPVMVKGVKKRDVKDKNGKVIVRDGKNVQESVPVLYSLAPAGQPKLITSWEQFKNNFGDFQPENSRLAHAVYGFFNNGGTRAWVARVAMGAKAEAYQDVLDKFHAIDEIALVVVPGASKDVQDMVLNHCEDEYLQDRFAILDGQPVTDLTKDGIQGVRDSDHGYGAIYYPWIEVYDPITDAHDYVPPSGHIAGIYARVDEERGVHKAPANEIIRGALGVGVKPAGGGPPTPMALSKADQAGLNPHGINVIRKFDGDIRVWGARTLATDVNPEWRYINVRRLFLFVRKSIDHGTQWVVFEPNAPPLWGNIRRDVSDFLRRVWRSGALFGATEAEAFYVKCDETNNPSEVRDAGQVIIEIGLAVVKPAEFVVFRICQWEPNPS
jgi:phage tail sheath protein FI